MGRKVDIHYDTKNWGVLTVELDEERSKLSNEEIFELINNDSIDFDVEGGLSKFVNNKWITVGKIINQAVGEDEDTKATMVVDEEV